ncbi:hypothetical protein [Neisseria iguanae]|uniref:hypothetical protein n=1 Tax=Neisseria iguanae TaxID=90242 RepID=UPI001FE97B7A|nr:hypothetical protein [Neisseria iguanae]
MPPESHWQVAPLWDICGQIGTADQAEGRDALQWLNKQTEIQMWLHNHPLNRQRQNHQAPSKQLVTVAEYTGLHCPPAADRGRDFIRISASMFLIILMPI